MPLHERLKNYFCSALPEKQFFSIEELLERWAEDRVTYGHFIDWVEKNCLVMAVRVRDAGSLSEQIMGSDGIVRTRQITRIALVGPTDFPALRTDYLGSETLLKILSAPEGVRVEAPLSYPNVDRVLGTEIYNGRFYSTVDLVVPLTEVTRMEVLFRIGKHTPSGVRLLRFARRLLEFFPSLIISMGEKFIGKDSTSKPGA